jgi:hypothetical protein
MAPGMVTSLSYCLTVKKVKVNFALMRLGQPSGKKNGIAGSVQSGKGRRIRMTRPHKS